MKSCIRLWYSLNPGVLNVAYAALSRSALSQKHGKMWTYMPDFVMHLFASIIILSALSCLVIILISVFTTDFTFRGFNNFRVLVHFLSKGFEGRSIFFYILEERRQVGFIS
jgi:hypothetical protein